MKTYAVILAGGKGERFWPRSRRSMPKQFLHLFGDESLIQMTSRRIAPICPIERQRFVIDYTLGKLLQRELRLRPRNFVYEPYGRNTAPALALAAAYVAKEEPDATMVVLPADHLIKNERAFQRCVRSAVTLAQQDYLVTFGIPPTRPDTNYGYIETGDPLAVRSDGDSLSLDRERVGVRVTTRSLSVHGRDARATTRRHPSYSVRRFREKPDLAQAKRFLKAGGFYWNSGMFVWRADVFLHAVGWFMPEFHQELMKFQLKIGTRTERAALDRLYAQAKSDSVDYAIMEHARNVAVVRADFDWDDVGSWPALERHFPHDANGNVVLGRAVVMDSRNCMSLSDEGIIALIGCEDLIVVRTPDALLVCRKDRAGEIKKLLATMSKDAGYSRHL